MEDLNNQKSLDIVGNIYIPVGQQLSIPIQNGKKVYDFN